MIPGEKEKAIGPSRFVTSSDPDTDLFFTGLLRRIAEQVVRETEDRGFLSLVLGGSLALGEGSGYRETGGGVQPGSDIDLYLIVEEGLVGEWSARAPGFRERLLSALGVPGLVVDLGATSPDRLAGLRPSVAHCLLVRYGRTLAGDPGVLRRAPRLSFEDIPPWDGLLLLLNRVVELLAEWRTAPREGGEEREFWYRAGKTVRDLGTSALVAGGAFVPTIVERMDAVPAFLDREGLSSRIPDFADDHRFWCVQKGRPDEVVARERHGGAEAEAEARSRIARYVDALYRWETARIFGAREGATPLEAMAGSEKLRRRVRAWAAHAGRGGRGALRHLAAGLPATPLRANYAAAVGLLLASGPLRGGEASARDEAALREACRAAPGAPPEKEGDYALRWGRLRNRVCAFWNREVMGGTRPPVPLR
ncbi:MAG: hypothetical protein ABIK65_01325 [Candidatus Eisenbacteria bacterium]